MQRRRIRTGFTLLEMILALSIGLVLLGALYQTLNGQLFQAQAGRDVLQEGTLARNILTRMASDILCQLGDVQLPPETSSSGTASADASSTSTTSTSTSGAGASPASGTPATTDMTTVTQQSPVRVNLGVQGDAGRLTLSVTRVPRELLVKADSQAQRSTSDLQRITYWVLESGGLARQEIRGVTGSDADTTPPDVADPERFVIAPEVTYLEISYFDGSSWVSEWDGTALGGPLLDTPVGPPCAIAIIIRIRRPRSLANEDPTEVEYRHVVAIPTANGFGQGEAP